MVAKALLVITDGSEEMELTIACNVMRRGGIQVTVAGLDGTEPVVCARKLLVKPEESFDDAVKKGPYDVIVLPGGGKGAENFCKCEKLGKVMKEQEAQGRAVAAICAAPTALQTHGIYLGKKVTSYPSFKASFKDYDYKEDKVVEDGNLITSRGPGTAFDFGLKLVERFVGKSVADKIAGEMLM